MRTVTAAASAAFGLFSLFTGASGAFNVVDPKSPTYAASGSAAVGTCSTTANGLTLSECHGISDFVANEGIVCKSCGGEVTISTPTDLTVTPSCTGARCTTSGTTTYSYKVTAVQRDGGETAASVAATTTHGVATLTTGVSRGGGSLTTFNHLTWRATEGAIAYIIYRRFGENYNPISYAARTWYDDYGSLPHNFGYSTRSPAVAVPTDVVATIRRVSGNTITLISAKPISRTLARSMILHDDTAAVQAAINAAGAGGRIEFPPGIYNFHIFNHNGSAAIPYYAWYINKDNVTITSAATGTATLKQIAAPFQAATLRGITRVITIDGRTDADGNFKWGKDFWARGLSRLPGYTIADAATPPYPAGTTALTLARAADAGNFSPGDDVVIRTGQILSSGTNPDGEINEVENVDRANGVIYLKYPTARPYRQECYVTGSGGFSSSDCSGGHARAPFALIRATGAVLHNETVERMEAELYDNISNLVYGIQIVGYNLRGLRQKGGVGFAQPGRNRFARIEHNDVTLTGNPVPESGISGFASCDQGCSDMIVEGNTLRARFSTCLVGSVSGANLLIKDNVVDQSRPETMITTQPGAAITGQTRCYNIRIIDNRVSNPQDNLVFLGAPDHHVHGDLACSGIISGNRYEASPNPNPLAARPFMGRLFGDNWTIRGNVAGTGVGDFPDLERLRGPSLATPAQVNK